MSSSNKSKPARPKVGRPPLESLGKEIKFLLTIEDVAKYFDVKEATVRLWISQGNLQAYRINPENGSSPTDIRTKIYITPESMREWTMYYFKIEKRPTGGR